MMPVRTVPAFACSSSFVNDFSSFVAAIDVLNDIDFETLPNGTPSVAGTAITPEFNYGYQGVEFTAGVIADIPTLIIGGNSTTGFDLRADGDLGAEVAIRIDFPTSVIAADMFSPATLP